MNCSDIDIKDYFFGELPAAARDSAAHHLASCPHCAAELEQLHSVRGALMTLRDEEPPQRIGFVSDKIFEPSPFRRWWSAFWLSGARLGFASAAMLSVALLVFSARQQPKVIERRVEVAAATAQVDVKAAVAEAVKLAMAEQEKKTREMIQASDRKHEDEKREMALLLSDYTLNVEKRMAANKVMAMDYNNTGGQR